MAINYLIIDDEPLAHQLIDNFAKQLPYMCKVASCHNAIEATPYLNEHQVDLVFLDVNMPTLSGFELLKSLKHPPKVIIVSAHKEYALESYEYAIADYLLKPFNFERFFKAIQKVTQSLAQNPSKGSNKNDGSEQSIFIKDDKKHHKVQLKNIRYIKANGNYTSVYLTEQSIISQMKISDFEKLLPKSLFARVHRSYIVSSSAITLVKASEVHLGDEIIPVGRVYKDSVVGLVNRIKFYSRN